MRSTRSVFFASSILLVFMAGLFIIYKGGVYAQGDVTAETGYRKLIDPNDYGTVLMQRTTKGLKDTRQVRFPHWAHRTKYTCSVCHTDLNVPMKAGESELTHTELDTGTSCGACHNASTAFSTKTSCDRCHSYGIDVPENSKIETSLKGLPTDPFGNRVDWAEALRKGDIRPGASVDGSGKLKARKGDVILPVTKFTPHPPDVKFSHEPHSAVIKCETCHPAIFQEKKGGNPDMSMLKFMSGQYCGVCHGRVSFPLGDCFRCHSQPAPEPEDDKKKK